MNTPPLRKLEKRGYILFKSENQKVKTGFYFFNNFAAFRAGFYSFQKFCDGVLSYDFVFVFSSILHCKINTSCQILPKNWPRFARGSIFNPPPPPKKKSARGSILFKSENQKVKTGFYFFKIFPKKGWRGFEEGGSIHKRVVHGWAWKRFNNTSMRSTLTWNHSPRRLFADDASIKRSLKVRKTAVRKRTHLLLNQKCRTTNKTFRTEKKLIHPIWPRWTTLLVLSPLSLRSSLQNSKPVHSARSARRVKHHSLEVYEFMERWRALWSLLVTSLCC